VSGFSFKNIEQGNYICLVLGCLTPSRLLQKFFSYLQSTCWNQQTPTLLSLDYVILFFRKKIFIEQFISLLLTFRNIFKYQIPFSWVKEKPTYRKAIITSEITISYAEFEFVLEIPCNQWKVKVEKQLLHNIFENVLYRCYWKQNNVTILNMRLWKLENRISLPCFFLYLPATWGKWWICTRRSSTVDWE